MVIRTSPESLVMQIEDINLPSQDDIDIIPYIPVPELTEVKNAIIVTALVQTDYFCRNPKCGQPFKPEMNTSMPRCPVCKHKAALDNLPNVKQCMIIVQVEDKDLEYIVPFEVIKKLPLFESNTSDVSNDDIENYLINISNTMNTTIEVDSETGKVHSIKMEAMVDNEAAVDNVFDFMDDEKEGGGIKKDVHNQNEGKDKTDKDNQSKDK